MIERIGIVGGGQLGRQMVVPAKLLGFDVTVLEKGETSPAAQVGARQIDGAITDPEGIERLVTESDVTTWEIEHVGIDTLIELNERGENIQSDPNTLKIIQDKLIQKQFLTSIGVPVAPFNEGLGVRGFVGGGPFVVKARKGGFDGRGNLKVNHLDDERISETFGNTPIYTEQVVDFDKELAVIAARDVEGNIKTYQPVETVHENNICHTVISPANIDPKLAKDAEELARTVMGHLEGAGVFAFEMFAVGDNVMINEIAPRVHNSGHLTIEANATSQFEQHIRAVTGMPLGSTEQRPGAAVMVNILGKEEGPLDRAGLENVLYMPDTHVHLYGKTPRKARKIGHVTTIAASRDAALDAATLARDLLIKL